MIRARLRVRVPNESISQSLVHAVDPDNRKLAGLRITPAVRRRSAEFRIEFSGGVGTFISTLDDLLRCLQAAKSTLDSVAERAAQDR